MHYTNVRVACAVASLTFAGIALPGASFAGDPKVTVKVGGDPTVVSVSRSGAAYTPGSPLPPGVFLAALNVSVKNGSRNNINNFRVEVNSVVALPPNSPEAPPEAPFVQAIGATCNLTPPNSSPGSRAYITCPLGTIRSGREVNFTVVFRTPASGDTITFKSMSYYGEGSKDNPVNSSHLDGTPGSDIVTTLTTLTSAEIATQVKTFVPPSGATSSTGATDIPNCATDKWISTVVVPPLPSSVSYTTALIDETPTPQNDPTCMGCSDSLTTRLAIPENAPGTLVFQGVAGNPDSGWLKMRLRRDACTIPSVAVEASSPPVMMDIKDAVIFYKADGASSFIELRYLCESGWPTAGRPCILSRYQYPADYPVEGLRLDWEFWILMRENGRYAQ